MEEFSTQQQAISQDWDQLHRDFDQWRTGLTACDRSSAEEALQDFAVKFNVVTELSRDLPRSEVIRELADATIAAAEAEEAAYRQLRDQWQPNSVSLFEKVEEKRVESSQTQRDVEDRAEDLREDLGEMTDPAELRKVEELSAALTSVEDALTQSHDEFTLLWNVSGDLEVTEFASQLIDLIKGLEPLLNEINRLPATETVDDEVELLGRAAKREISSLEGLYEALTTSGALDSLPGDRPPPIPGQQSEDLSIEAHVEAVNGAIGEAEAALKDAKGAIDDILDGSASERLEDVVTFVEDYNVLRDEWDGSIRDITSGEESRVVVIRDR